MGSQEGNLPAYTIPGRGSMPGPRTGVYFVWMLSGKDLVQSATEEYRFVAPADLRLQEITVIADVVVSNPTYRVEKGYTLGGGDDIIAATIWPASDVAATTAGSSLSFRDIPKDEYVTIQLDADSGDTLLAYTMTITGYYKGHIHTDPADD